MMGTRGPAPAPAPGTILHGKYQLDKKIESGSFGDVYLGNDVSENLKTPIAVKLEKINPQNYLTQQLLIESKVYRILNGGIGIPKTLWFGEENGYNVLVMDLLGPSLAELFDTCSGRFTLKTVLMLGFQMIARLSFIHSKNMIHRDLKPNNFLMGLGVNSKMVHLIDFGVAKKFFYSKTQQHIPFRDGKTVMLGSIRYTSIRAQQRCEQSRRDDLESLGYILIYFLKGELPWQGIKGKTQMEKYDKILQCKISTSVESLCEGCPPLFLIYLTYCKSLRFNETPDYVYLQGMFKSLFNTLYTKDVEDYNFDWMGPTPIATPTAHAPTAP